MKILITEQLSKNKYKDNSGYLICKDAIIARTGTQQYLSKELFEDGDDTIIDVDRPKEEVLNAKTIASFENKPVTDEHPDVDVVPLNCKDLQIGFARDIHPGQVDGTDVLLATLVITDADAIEMIENGEKVELSCGYDCDIMKDNDGNYYQANIRGNHIALCEAGRAGIARIVDSKVEDISYISDVPDYVKKMIPAIESTIKKNNKLTSNDDYAESWKEYEKDGLWCCIRFTGYSSRMRRYYITICYTSYTDRILKEIGKDYTYAEPIQTKRLRQLVKDLEATCSKSSEFYAIYGNIFEAKTHGKIEIWFDVVQLGKKLNYDDDLVVISKNGRELYKGIYDYSNYDISDFSWNQSKGLYENKKDKSLTLKVVDAAINDGYFSRYQAGEFREGVYKVMRRSTYEIDKKRHDLQANPGPTFDDLAEAKAKAKQLGPDYVVVNLYTRMIMDSIKDISLDRLLEKATSVKAKEYEITTDEYDVDDIERYLKKEGYTVTGYRGGNKASNYVTTVYFTKDSMLKDTAMTITVQCYILDDDKILIQDRVSDIWHGLAVPGGHVKNEETTEAACIREIKEETGLDVSGLTLFGTHEYTCEEDGQCIALLYKTSTFGGELQSSDEGQVKWMTIDEVLKSDNTAEGFKDLLTKCVGNSVKDAIKDAGTQRRQFRQSDIDEEGSWLGTTEWGTPKGSMYVYKKDGKIVAECKGAAYFEPKGIFKFSSLQEFNKWLLDGKMYVSAIKDAYRNPFRGPSNQQVGDDAYYGFNDATAGYYDKWYRYNRKDNGRRYDEGVKEAMKQGATIEHYIEEPRAFDSMPSNIQYSRRTIDKKTIFDLKIDGKYVASFDSFNTMIFYISKYSK